LLFIATFLLLTLVVSRWNAPLAIASLPRITAAIAFSIAVETGTTAVDTFPDAVESASDAVDTVQDAVETVADDCEKLAIIAELPHFRSFSTTSAKEATGCDRPR
jgi:hypothetical protein